MLAATHDGSHLTGGALLPYLAQLAGVSESAPSWRLRPAFGGSDGSYIGDTLQLDADTGVSGAGVRSTVDLASYFDAASKGIVAPDWNAFTTPAGHYEGGSDGGYWVADEGARTLDQGAFAAAWRGYQSRIASAFGLDPSADYFVAHLASNPTSSLDSRDTVDALYQVRNGTAVAIDARNIHENSWWVDQGRDVLMGAAIVGSAGLAWGALGTPAAEAAAPASSGSSFGGTFAADYGLASGATGGTGLTATAGQGLTLAATTGTGAGLTAAAGEGLTLAAMTGTGAGLAIGTGANIIGAGIGEALAGLGLSASQAAAWSAPAVAAAADSVVAPAAAAASSSSALPSLSSIGSAAGSALSSVGSAAGSVLGAIGSAAKAVLPLAPLLDLINGTAPAQTAAQNAQSQAAAQLATAQAQQRLLLIGGCALAAVFIATRSK